MNDGQQTEEAQPRRAAAICEDCGSCHVVRVRPDGTIRVIGTNGSCECGGSEYRVLGPKHAGGTDAEATRGERRGA